MKPTVIAVIGMVTLCPLPSAAQPRHARPEPVANMEALLSAGRKLPAAQPAAKLPPAKAAAASSRLIGTYYGAGSNGQYRNSDSTSFTYSGGRGGDLNSDLNFDTSVVFVWDSISAAWIPGSRVFASYDAEDRMLSQVTQGWNAPGSAYTNSLRQTNTYDAQGRISKVLSESWDPGTKTWKSQQQLISFSYNGAGKLLGYTSQRWIQASMSWQNLERFSSTYEAGGNRVQTELLERWISNAWEKAHLQTYGYDASGHNTSYIYQYWDNVTESWKNSLSYYYYYNAAGALLAYASRLGDGTGLGWVNGDSISNTSLNTAGRPLGQLRFRWSTSNWQPLGRTTYTYTGGGSLESSRVEEAWNGTAFANKARAYSQYNGFGQLSRSYSESYAGNLWGVHPGDTEQRYHYQNYETAVPPAPTASLPLQLSPNPANTRLSIEAGGRQVEVYEIAVYDLMGRPVLRQRQKSTGVLRAEISTLLLPDGIYLVRVSGGSESRQQRFAVQH